jgi:tellurite methyltransferase
VASISGRSKGNFFGAFEMPKDVSGVNAPEDFILRFANHALSLGDTPDVLDVACGAGRHAIFFARNGCHVAAMERSAEQLALLAENLKSAGLTLEVIRADVERMSLLPESFDAIVNTFFLFRPLAEQYVAALRPGGVLYFRTFTTDHCNLLGNTRPRLEFLLELGELGRMYAGLKVIHYEETIVDGRARATLVAAKRRW